MRREAAKLVGEGAIGLLEVACTHGGLIIDFSDFTRAEPKFETKAEQVKRIIDQATKFGWLAEPQPSGREGTKASKGVRKHTHGEVIAKAIREALKAGWRRS
jgi:hypothetical protein